VIKPADVKVASVLHRTLQVRGSVGVSVAE